jgi:hypothetical protein
VPFANEHAARQTDPGQYSEFARTHPEGFPAGIDAIFGIKSVEGKRVSEIQSLRAAKDQWTVAEFSTWLEGHDFKTTIEAASGDSVCKLRTMTPDQLGAYVFDETRTVCCTDKLIELVHDAKALRQDGDTFVLEGVRRTDYLGRISFDKAEADKEGVFVAEETEEGFLRVDGRISRSGVQPYADADGNRWNEFRPDSEVFSPDSMKSFQLKVITENHPDEMVTIDNVAEVQRGHTGTDVRRDEDFLRSSMLITNKDAIKSAKDGSVAELSAGYTADVRLEDGVSPDGQAYQAVQENIRGNHVAKVDAGRCGPECRLLTRGDAAQLQHDIPRKDSPMPKFNVNGQDIELDEETSARLAAMLEQTAGAGDQEMPGEGGGEEEEEKEESQSAPTPPSPVVSSHDSELRARVDVLETELKKQKDTETHRIDARVSIVSNARKICGSSYEHEGKTDSAIMMDVILKLQPEMKDRLEANKSDRGYLKCAFDSALKIESERKDSSGELLVVTAISQTEHADGIGELNSIYREYTDRLEGRKSADDGGKDGE